MQRVAGAGDVALAFSGGPDSMALLALLQDWVKENGGLRIHALHVDHGLRVESAREAEALGRALQNTDGVHYEIMKWEEKASSGIQEAARKARYDLMASYCRAHGICYLFVAHHQDDQAETFLFRLAKGSGLDGLSSMQPVQDYGEDIIILRPLLSVEKNVLISLCQDCNLEYIEDPSNDSEEYSRVRLRKSQAVLETEGLSSKRLSVTAKRLSRARFALDTLAQKALQDAIIKKEAKRFVLKYDVLQNWPDEIALRAVLKVIETLRPESDYAPRMEKVESLFYDLRSPEPFRKRTLGGLVFERNDDAGEVLIMQEMP